MTGSDKTGIWWAKQRFKLKRFRTRFASHIYAGAVASARAIWSLRGAAAIPAVAALGGVAQLFLTVQGKLVILPFEVHAESSLPSDIGSAFAAGLASRLNDYKKLYPPLDQKEAHKAILNKNSFDIILSFMTDLPYVNIPRSSPLNKGSTALESVKIGPLSIPVRQIIFENLAFFHNDTVRGSLDVWGDEITARVSVGSDEEIIVSLPKEQGFNGLIDRLSVELMAHKNWMSPFPMKASALVLFTEGIKYYLDYGSFGDEQLLARALGRYRDALEADRNADLARLHLASTQYRSVDPNILREAVENFSILRGSSQFQAQARMGYAAALLRYMERTPDCGSKLQFLDHVLKEVESWAAPRSQNPIPAIFAEVVLQGDAYRAAASYLVPTSRCSFSLRKLLRVGDFETFASRAEASYGAAVKMLISNKIFDEDQTDRYMLFIRLQRKYLLNDRTDFSILGRKDSLDIANSALDAGLDLARSKAALPNEQKRVFAPYLAGSNAESYLRLAGVIKNKPKTQAALVVKAIEQFRLTITSGDEGAARWAMLRLADLELSRHQPAEAFEWFKLLFNKSGNSAKSFFEVIDEGAFASGVLIEKNKARCGAIDLFSKTNLADSFIGRLFLADAHRRSGNLTAAANVLEELETDLGTATQWTGVIFSTRIALVRAKFAARKGDRNAAQALQSQLKNLMNEPMDLSLLADAYELAHIIEDEESLNQLTVVKDKMPFVDEFLRALKDHSQACSQPT